MFHAPYLVEGCGAQMHILHEDQQVKSWVSQSLHETSLDTSALFQANSIPLYAIVRQLSLLGSQPPRRQRLIRQQESTNDRHAHCDDTLNDKQPLPSMHSVLVVQRRKRSSGDEPSKRHSKDIPGIQDRNSCSYLFTRIKHAQDVQSTRVEWRFYKTEEEAYQDQPSVVLDKSCQSCYTAPD